MSPDPVPPPPPASRSLSPRKELVTAWLLFLLDGGATYGYVLRRELDEHRVHIDPPSVYRCLRRLEQDGWVQSRWMRSVAGPHRRFYRLTSRGRRRLHEIAELIAATRDSHDVFLRAYESRTPSAQRTPEADSANASDSSS